MDDSKTGSCPCAICALNLDFAFDEHLLKEVERHNCVVFAGAGISTETKYTHPTTLYKQLKVAVGCKDNPSFPELVDRFEVRPNGRQEFIQLVVDRFAYINSFRELRGNATRFHRALATMPYFNVMVTTNWDRYFEEEVAATPFVAESDIPFWENAKRSVVKIHGSIDNYTSIVASSEDYQNCESRLREGAVGAVLKQIFATKTCLFFGYSATDEDFLKIYETVRTGLGRVARTHYLVSPFVDDGESARLYALGIKTIKTDATYFLDSIKSHMIGKFCFAPDSTYDAIAEALFHIYEIHNQFVSSYKPKSTPHLIFSTVYQDGLIHGFQRFIDLRSSGSYSDLHYVRAQIHLYEKDISDYFKRKDYWEISYFTGYLTALEYFDMLAVLEEEETPDLPEFFHPSKGQMYKEEFDLEVRSNPEVHKASLNQARKLLKHWPDGEVIQHLPWA